VWESLESGYKLRVLKLSTIAISSVVLVEVILGAMVNSLAILSDGLHALLDALTTLILFVTTRMSVKPPDEEHMYGHEKFESIGGLVGGIILIGVALLIVYEAVLKMLANQPIRMGLEYVGFMAIGYTFCIDFFRVGSLLRARHSESSTMKAGFYHAIADLSSTIIALLGFGLATLGFYRGDSLASIVLGVLLSYLSVRLVWASGMELSDAISKSVAEKVRATVLSTKEVCKCEDLKIRKAGDKTFVRATVQVPDYLGLEEAHNLTSKVEADIVKALGNAVVTIHTEPCTAEMSTERLVEKLAGDVQGVREVHETNIAYKDGKLYITLHAYVDPQLSVQKAHEIAERIEENIGQRVGDVEDVTIHAEPFTIGERKGTTVNENEVRRIVHRAAKSYQNAFHVKRIVTYVADKKRYINVNCSFAKHISIEEAHKISSQIEEQIKQHFSETTVTVHMEPN
jgi:cation diffusion facilitator family transporter